MRECPDLLPDGWYQPPPTGASVLIGSPPTYARVEYESLRDPHTWPRADIRLRDDSLVYAYASPTDRATGMIGDIGVTLYHGPDHRIRQHVATCLELTVRIAALAEVGMELRELYHQAERLVKEAGLGNRTASATDSGAPNIGHTIPWTFGDYSAEDERRLRNGDPADVSDLISRQRIFLNPSTRRRIEPTMAFTVEPRMSSPSLPLSSFHIIVAFREGRKTISSEFGRLFRIFGMEEYLPRKALEALGEPFIDDPTQTGMRGTEHVDSRGERRKDPRRTRSQGRCSLHTP